MLINKIPHIFIFDIDNCIIGKVDYIVSEWIIYETIDNIVPNNVNKLDHNKCHFVDDMHNGLLRPYVIDFIKYIKHNFKNCELFIYTNSSYGWTNEVLVKNIEKASNIKFNKPYFTRENSIMCKKSLSKIYKNIISVLKKKYNNKLLDKNLTNIINNKLIFIDNIKDNTSTHINRQLTCPYYNNIVYRDTYENMLKIFGIDIMNTDAVKKIFDKNDVLYINTSTTDLHVSDKLLYNIYRSYLIRSAELTNEMYKDDKYFNILIKKLTNLSDKKIKEINIFFEKNDI